ncbi:MAG: hypothetical protein IJJ72_03910 [Bacteroidales bacterium]|nr:hypothetical protein [Bacteroidales bacterium]
MKKFLAAVFCAIVVDAFFWDFTLVVFPIANSKMILAVVGIIAYLFISHQEHGPSMSNRVIKSGFIAVLFSLWCYIAITINGTGDMTYVRYFTSFATWVGGAYGTYAILRRIHGRVDLMLITRYLAIVCVAQCVIALLIENIPAVESLVKSIFSQGYDFFERGGRLYGIGCALDPAGVRFSGIQVLIAHQIVAEPRVRESLRKSGFLFIAFLVITVIGCVISRTTTVGSALGLAYIIFGMFRMQRGGNISRIQIALSVLLILLISATIGITVYLYHSSASFYSDMRFGFEGFFNWVEYGEFRTTSTDILMSVMWVWPTDPHGWLVGYGLYGLYTWGTDIGYCNFVLYCGLVGLVIYSFYYLYNHLSLISKFNRFIIPALLLTAVTFIVWAKVATDIFLIDALLFCIDGDKDSPPGKTA